MFSKGFLTIEDIVHESLLSRTGAVNLIKGITYTQDLKFVKACLVKLEKQREVKYKHINI